MSTVSFLESLYGGLTRSYHLAIWEMPGKRTAWFEVPEGLQEAASAGLRLSGDGSDVYFGLGLQTADLGPLQRGTAASVAAIPGLWADIDVAGGAHTKTNLPPDLEAALGLVGEMPLPPTMLISSGHGIHAYWLFHEPWELESSAERDEAAWMLRGWQAIMRTAAARHGWEVDSTSDLSRVLRLPGTLNRKDPEHVERVVELQDDGALYAREDVEVHLSGFGEVQHVTPAALTSWAPPRAMEIRLRMVIDADEKLKASWNHRRPDLQDQSLSGYDASIASIAAGHGLSEDDIATLVTFHRLEWGDDRDIAKGARRDYLARTVGWALRGREVKAAVAAGEVIDADERTIGALREWEDVGVTGITGWYVVQGADNEFVLSTPNGELRFTSNQLATYRIASGRVATHLGRTLVTMKQDAWLQCVARLKQLAETRGEMDNPIETIEAWLREYRVMYGTLEGIEGRKAALDNGGVVQLEDGRIALRGEKLLRWIQAHAGHDKLSLGELKSLWLRAGGKTSVKVAIEERSTRSCWAIVEGT